MKNKSLGIYNLIDTDGINRSIKNVINNKINFNTYTSPKGLKELRVKISDWLNESWRINLSYKELLITSGSQQSINLIAYSLLNKGDTILIEQPTYFGAIDIFKKLDVNLVGVNLNDNGIDLEELEIKLNKYKPKLIYVTPTFNNPTGIAWKNDVRKKFLELVNKYYVIVVEDDPYSLINYSDYDYRSLYELNNGNNVIYLGTFSKIISPSINVGYVICSDNFMNKIYSFKKSFDLCTSLFNQYVILDYLDNNNLNMILKVKVLKYKELLKGSLDKLNKEYSGYVVSYSYVDGGLFYLVKFKDVINEDIFENGNNYYIEGIHNNETRINICSEL